MPTLTPRSPRSATRILGKAASATNCAARDISGSTPGLAKDWQVREGQTLSFSWEAFNVTNAVRFDAAQASNNFDLTSSTNFGVYNNTLTQPRVMQFMLRYSF